MEELFKTQRGQDDSPVFFCPSKKPSNYLQIYLFGIVFGPLSVGVSGMNSSFSRWMGIGQQQEVTQRWGGTVWHFKGEGCLGALSKKPLER